MRSYEEEKKKKKKHTRFFLFIKFAPQNQVSAIHYTLQKFLSCNYLKVSMAIVFTNKFAVASR